jgi:hypothetical protein
VDLCHSDVELIIRLPQKVESLIATIFRNNTQVMSRAVSTAPEETADGYMYKIDVSPTSMGIHHASLLPFTVVWKYTVPGSSQSFTETSNLYLHNPTILTAGKDLENFVNRAYTDNGIDPSTLFTPIDVARHLRKGMDMFNSAIRPTNFNMTNAQGAVRQFWIQYATIDACRSQYLAEGMKAFDFAGQSVSLTVDRSQFWDSMANSIQSECDSFVKQLKDNLAKWGYTGGDGNIIGPLPGAVGAIGIALSPLTPLRQKYLTYMNFSNGQPS